MTHASVFSGIGGPEVAATMLGWENLFHCEINPFGKRVLDYWYPKAESYDDITKTDFTKWRGRVDVLTGGFPCQPFSYAGRRKGADDDRYLWPHMFRCIDEIRPTWVVAENVAGITTMVEQGKVSEVASQATLFGEGDTLHRYQLRETFTLERICHDLESHGYSVQPVLIPACAVGAPHRRDRVFIVARRIDAPYPNGARARDNDGATCDEGRTAREDWRESLRQGHGQTGASRTEPTSANAPTDTVSSREGTSRTSGSIESDGSDPHQQSSERRATTEWSDRFYAILRPSADTDDTGERTPDKPSGREWEKMDGERRDESFDGAGRLGTPRTSANTDSDRGCKMDEHMESELADGAKPVSNGGQRNVADTDNSGLQEARPEQSAAATWGTHLRIGEWNQIDERSAEVTGCGRWNDFPSVSPVHRGNDGIPFDVDCLTISFGKWRTEALKAYGNAIVPQVMYEIFRAIEKVEK